MYTNSEYNAEGDMQNENITKGAEDKENISVRRKINLDGLDSPGSLGFSPGGSGGHCHRPHEAGRDDGSSHGAKMNSNGSSQRNSLRQYRSYGYHNVNYRLLKQYTAYNSSCIPRTCNNAVASNMDIATFYTVSILPVLCSNDVLCQESVDNEKNKKTSYSYDVTRIVSDYILSIYMKQVCSML